MKREITQWNSQMATGAHRSTTILSIIAHAIFNDHCQQIAKRTTHIDTCLANKRNSTARITFSLRMVAEPSAKGGKQVKFKREQASRHRSTASCSQCATPAMAPVMWQRPFLRSAATARAHSSSDIVAARVASAERTSPPAAVIFV